MRFIVASALVSITALATACSSSSESATGGDAGADAATTDGGGGADASSADAGSADSGPESGIKDGAVSDAGAASLGPLMPQVVRLNAASVIASPKVMPILYENDPNKTDVEAFVPSYAASTAWAAHTSEYGVGALTALAPKHLTGSAPATIKDADVVTLLKTNLGGNTPAWGAPDPSTVYAFFFPKGTIVDDGSGGKSCTDYDGYHYTADIGNVTVPYAIIVQCPGFDGMNITDLQQLTIVASHELVEAVTDPMVQTNPGYAQPDDPHAVWGVITGGEVGDMCAFAETFAWKPNDMNYYVQRSWSNAAAAAGHDPCVGAGSPYYQAVPTLPDSVTINGPVHTKGLKVARGTTGTLTLTVYADTPSAGPFTIAIEDYNSAYANGNKLLDFTVPSGQVNAGDQITVTVQALGKDMNLGNAAAFVVNTKPVGGGPTTFFYGLIGE